MKKKVASAIVFVLFVIWTVLVKMECLTKIDTGVYNFVTKPMCDGLTTFYKLVTNFGSTIFIVALVILFFAVYMIKKHKEKSYFVAATLIISTILNNVVKLIIRRARPDVLKLVIEKTFSYPSGHTMASVSLYGLLIFFIVNSKLDKKYKILLSTLLVIVTGLVLVSRIYLGAHFFSDIIGGVLLSTSLLLILTSFFKKEWN